MKDHMELDQEASINEVVEDKFQKEAALSSSFKAKEKTNSFSSA